MTEEQDTILDLRNQLMKERDKVESLVDILEITFRNMYVGGNHEPHWIDLQWNKYKVLHKIQNY